MSSTTTATGELPDVNPFSVETLLHPYETYRVLRDEAPVFHIPAMNLHYVTSYDLIREALKDTDT